MELLAKGMCLQYWILLTLFLASSLAQSTDKCGNIRLDATQSVCFTPGGPKGKKGQKGIQGSKGTKGDTSELVSLASRVKHLEHIAHSLYLGSSHENPAPSCKSLLPLHFPSGVYWLRPGRQSFQVTQELTSFERQFY